MKQPVHQLSRANVRVLAAFIAAAAVIALVWAGSLHSGVPTTALTNICGTLLAAALISFFYDTFVREAFTRELLSLVHLQRQVADAGLLSITTEAQVDFEGIFSGASQIRLILKNAAWIEPHWSHITADKKVPLLMLVEIADPAGPASVEYAASHGMDMHQAMGVLQGGRKQLERLWEAAALERSLPAGSRLQIGYLKQQCDYQVVASNDAVVFLIDGARGKKAGDQAVALEFDQQSALPVEWWRKQVAGGAATEPVYDFVVGASS